MNDRMNTSGAAIGTAELAERIERNDVFVLDLRRAVHGGQIYGSIRYDPKKLVDAARLVLPLPKTEGLIVLYDEDGSSKRLAELADKLRAGGYGEIRLLDGGFDAWKAADGKMQEASMEQPVPLVSEHQIER